MFYLEYIDIGHFLKCTTFKKETGNRSYQQRVLNNNKIYIYLISGGVLSERQYCYNTRIGFDWFDKYFHKLFFIDSKPRISVILYRMNGIVFNARTHQWETHNAQNNSWRFLFEKCHSDETLIYTRSLSRIRTTKKRVVTTSFVFPLSVHKCISRWNHFIFSRIKRSSFT